MSVLKHSWPLVGSRGSIIVTTRNAVIAKTYCNYTVDVPLLSRLESREFLTKLSNSAITRSQDQQQDVKVLDELAEISGRLPLVLDLLRHQIFVTHTSAAQFLRNHSVVEQTIFSDSQSRSWHSESYPLTVVAALTMGLRKMDPSAQEMMAMCSHFRPDSIPMELFTLTRAQM